MGVPDVLSDTVAAFVQLAAELANAAGWWDVDDLHKFSAGNFEAPSRCCVVGIAGDPDRIDAESARKRKDQGYRTGSVVVAAVRPVNAITDVAGVLLEMGRGTDAQVDLSEFLL